MVSDGSTWRVPSVGEDDVRLSGGVRWVYRELRSVIDGEDGVTLSGGVRWVNMEGLLDG